MYGKFRFWILGLFFKNPRDYYHYGVEAKLVTPSYCYTHGEPPITPAESLEFEEGLDPCIFSTRLILGDRELVTELFKKN